MPAANPAPQSDATDAVGVKHPEDITDARIVSLVPSLTELLCALGLAPKIVGRTGFCVHPKNLVRSIPKVGGTKTVNLERIKRLAPTHVIVNIDENTLPTVKALEEFVPHIVATHPKTVLDNLAVYRLFGALFGKRVEATRLESELCDRISRRQKETFKPRSVLYLIWKDPWMSISHDTYIADMLKQAGMVQIALADTARYPTVELPAASANAEAVLLSSEPFPFREEHRTELAASLGKPVLCIDGEMLSWYGSRAIDALDYIATVKAGLESALGSYST
jgi:ABC-type Fe3+-hydroxamate transport system substrate-binding protein